MSTMNLTAKHHESKGKQALMLIVSVAAPLLIGFFSSMLAGDMQAIYSGFTKPPLSPPNWLFGIAWAVLYVLMGIALFLVWREDAPMHTKRRAITFYTIQLALNFIWSPVFFGVDAHWVAAVIIIVMDVLVILTMRSFHAIRPVAVNLLIPYLAWLLFATYLTIGVAILN